MKKDQEEKTDPKRTAERQPKENTTPDKNKETIKALDMEDKMELERREAYIEPKARDLLRKLLQDGDKEEIVPIYSPNSGYVYQIANRLSSKNEIETVPRDLLENLALLNILQKNFFDSISSCPNCQSTILTLHNRCPKCKSHNVEKTSLTEHIPCGYIDQKDKYVNNRCPKCGEPLIEGQYRNMGRWYICQECGEKFENPEFDLVCRNCNKTFAIKEAKVTEIPKFSLNLTKKKEIRQNVASLEDIQILVAQLGFSVEMPGLTVGQKSKMQHHFSLIAKKQINGQEIVIALDHAVSELEVQTSPLILYLYKISEVKVDIPIFVAIPRLSDTAKKIAQGNNILLIEGSTDQAEAINNIKKEIENRINQISQKTVNESENQQSENKSETTSFFTKLRGIKKKNVDLTQQSKPISITELTQSITDLQRNKSILDWQPPVFVTKTVSLALIFNSLLGIIFSIGVLGGIYVNKQSAFGPLLIYGNLFWLLIVASILNILTAIKISQIQKTYSFQPKSILGKKILFRLQIATIFTSFYMFFAVTAYLGQNPAANTLTNLILPFALLFTGLISFGATIFKTWLK